VPPPRAPRAHLRTRCACPSSRASLPAPRQALEQHKRSLDDNVPCVNCPLPVPLKTWPCCEGALPQCQADGACGLPAKISAACTYVLVDHIMHGSGKCECNRCRQGDCGTGWD
jgi:hypothetical protein